MRQASFHIRDYHYAMLAEGARAGTFLRAILYTVRPGDVLVTETLGNVGSSEEG